jgi:hypothetical protein
MSGQDHPDIEKLPDHLHGIPVKEAIRNLFQDIKNGTPDNISKAGCLALAMRSIELGKAQGLGHILWNTWREAFPAVQNQSDKWRYTNYSDFSLQNFQSTLRDLQYFNFGSGANFDQSKWGIRATFSGATWGEHSRFFRAAWGDHCNFERARWGAFCRFDGATWGTHNKFNSATWEPNCIFEDARWGDFVAIADAELCSGLQFNNCVFGHSVNFDFSRFRSGLNFTGTIFEGLVQFSSSSNVDIFNSIDFRGCEFKGQVDFGGRKFLGKTNFGLIDESTKKRSLKLDENGMIVYKEDSIFPQFNQTDFVRRSVIFHKQPNFHGCELHQDTSFEGAEFPKPTGSEEAVRAYRTLKLAFSNQQATREHQRFFKFEMAEEGLFHRTSAMNALRMFKLRSATRDLWCWFLIMIYRIFADYGFSILRPFFFWCLSVIIFAYVYGLFSGYPICFYSNSCEIQAEWLKESLIYSMPFSGLDKFSKVNFDSLCFLIAVFIYKAFSILWFFLIGLALRNFFKLK